ncbi:MAG: NTPase [Candidatus Pacearchaeota archaeon]
MKIFISGLPGCGKTTLMLELVKELKAKNKKVAGIITKQILNNKKREGFLIEDLTSNKQEMLASIKQKEGPKVGKYRVNVNGIGKIVEEAEKNFENADIIIIDEIGRMEFFSEAFKAMLRKLIDSDKKIIATLHRAYVEKYRKQGIFIWLEKDKLQEVKNKIISLIGI